VSIAWQAAEFDGLQRPRHHGARPPALLPTQLYAVHATKNSLDVFRLSRILGHSSVNTTQIYLRSIGFEHLREGAKCSPLARAED
jgi:site-specific recombinase XerC